jgi:arylformamidase
MPIIDITRPLGPDTPVYPGDPPVTLHQLSAATDGNTFALSRLTLGTHAGTHVDAPAHILPGGATVDAIPLESCLGPATVLNVAEGTGLIQPEELALIPGACQRVLLRTGGPLLGGRALSEAAARTLVDRGVRLVGIDTLSVADMAAPGPVHQVLLAANVVIVEGLDLTAAPDGDARLICLPLKLTGGDGAPARAVLLIDD